MYVEYTCDLAAGTLSRSITPIGADAKNAAVTLVQNIIANPGDVPCFTYSSTEAASYSFVTNVGLTLTTRTSGIDPQTGTYATLTKSFLNLAPRNVAAALALAQAGVTGPLQPMPSGIPMS